MFYIRSSDSVQQVYQPGQLRIMRNIEPVSAAQEASALYVSPDDNAPQHNEKSASTVIEHYKATVNKEPEEVKFAHQIMSSPVFTTNIATELNQLTQIFSEKRFRHIPVVGETGNLVGLVSDRDLLRHRAKSSIASRLEDQAELAKLMVRQVLVASPDTLIREIARIMFDEKVGSIPIIDNDNLVGIITRSDILRALIKHGPLKIWV